MIESNDLPAPTYIIATVGESNELVRVPVDPALPAAAARLVDDLARYFVDHPDSVLVPLARLTLSRARPKGIGNAVNLMKAAYEGGVGRREPISVRTLGTDRYLVEDGNSTVAVARAAGWSHVPCLIDGRARLRTD